MKEQLNELPKLSQLEPLMSILNAEQQLQLRQALVRQTISYVSEVLPPKESVMVTVTAAAISSAFVNRELSQYT